MPFSSLGQLLSGAARRAGIGRDLAITYALRGAQEALADVFGPDYSRFAEPIAVRTDGALVIACRSPAVAQTVRLRADRMLLRVRTAAPSIRVERLYLVPRSREDVQNRSHCEPPSFGGTMEQTRDADDEPGS